MSEPEIRINEPSAIMYRIISLPAALKRRQFDQGKNWKEKAPDCTPLKNKL
jgi:hypothetical protein